MSIDACEVREMESDERKRRGADGSGRTDGGRMVQAALPLESMCGPDDSDRPIDYVLTAPARHLLDPEAPPDIALVPEPGPTHSRAAPEDGLPEVGDTRPSRARALARAGGTADQIARDLQVDPLLVRAWTEDAAPLRSRRIASTARTASPPLGGPVVTSARRNESAPLIDTSRVRAVRSRLRTEPRFALGVGLVASGLQWTPHAVTLSFSNRVSAAAAMTWLRDEWPIEESRIRVVLRVGSAVAPDAARHEWAESLGLDLSTVVVAAWRHAPDSGSEAAMVRIGGPEFARMAQSWVAALQDVFVPELDVAF